MKAIEQIYENYKASQNEENPYSEEQKREFDKLSVTLDKVFPEKSRKIIESNSRFLTIVLLLPDPQRKPGLF